MAGGQTMRLVVVGKQGSGKSVLVRSVIERMKGKYSQLVIVNIKRELSDLCEHGYVIERDGDPEIALCAHHSVFFQVTGQDPRPFLDKLGRAIMRRKNVLFVMDEAPNFVPPGRVAPGLYTLFTAGREQGHNLIVVSQMIQTPTGSLDPSIVKQASHIVSFRLSDTNEVGRAYQELKIANLKSTGIIETLKRPDDGGAPEYIVAHTDRDRVVKVSRLENPKKVGDAWLAA